MTDIGQIHIGEGDGDRGGECRSIYLFVQRSRGDGINHRRIIGTGRSNRNVLGDRTTIDVTNGDGKDFAGGLIKC